MKVPGFRSGKVPPQVVIQQVGREAVLDEAVRRGAAGLVRGGRHRGRDHHGRRPQRRPRATCPRRAPPLAFTVEVGVVPPAKLGDYEGIEVGRREPAIDPDEVQAELERVRESLASLETVERAAADGRLRGHGLRGLGRRRAVRGRRGPRLPLELGSGRLVPGFEEQLEGAAAGDERTVSLTFPDDYPAEHARRQGRRVRGRRSRRSRRSGCRSSTTSSPSRPAGTTRSTSSAPRSSEQLAAADERAIEARVPPGRRGRGGGALRGDHPARAGPLEGPRDVAPDRAPPVSAGRRPAPLPGDHRQDRGGAGGGGRARRRAGAAGARRCSPRSSRPRGSRSPTTRWRRPCARPPAPRRTRSS